MINNRKLIAGVYDVARMYTYVHEFRALSTQLWRREIGQSGSGRVERRGRTSPGKKKKRNRCDDEDFLTANESLHPRYTNNPALRAGLKLYQKERKPVNVPEANILRALIRRG